MSDATHPSSQRHAANPMKKRLLRSWDTPPRVATHPSSPEPPPADHPLPPLPPSPPPLPHPRRRRYPKLLSTDRNGNIIAHPLHLNSPKIPSPTMPVPSVSAPLPSKPSKSPKPPRPTRLPPRRVSLATPGPVPSKQLRHHPVIVPLSSPSSPTLPSPPALPASVVPRPQLPSVPRTFPSPPPLPPSSAPLHPRPLKQTDRSLGNRVIAPRRDVVAQPYSPPVPVSELETAVNNHFAASAAARLSASERSTAEKVIQVGRRCGTVQYWRSSLQMPKSSGVKKNASSKKTSIPVKKFPKPSREDEISRVPAALAVQTTRRPSLSKTLSVAKRIAPAPGPMPLQGPVMNSEPGSAHGSSPASVSGGWPWQKGSIPTDRGLVNPLATRTPLDTGQQHAFWRNATKLPSVSSDKARMKRLGVGRRKMGDLDEASDSGIANGGSIGQVPPSNRGGNVRVAPRPTLANEHWVGDSRVLEPCDVVMRNVPPQSQSPQSSVINTVVPGVSQAETGQRVVEITPQMVIDEEQTEMRRLHMTKDYEIRKLEAYAESRYHVKMNLRGRNKLENWLSTSDAIAANSVLFIVLVLNLDRRLVSNSARDRQDALEDMDNEHLRMLEALMARTSTRDGHTNWAVLTANFNVDKLQT